MTQARNGKKWQEYCQKLMVGRQAFQSSVIHVMVAQSKRYLLQQKLSQDFAFFAEGWGITRLV